MTFSFPQTVVSRSTGTHLPATPKTGQSVLTPLLTNGSHCVSAHTSTSQADGSWAVRAVSSVIVSHDSRGTGEFRRLSRSTLYEVLEAKTRATRESFHGILCAENGKWMKFAHRPEMDISIRNAQAKKNIYIKKIKKYGGSPFSRSIATSTCRPQLHPPLSRSLPCLHQLARQRACHARIFSSRTGVGLME